MFFLPTLIDRHIAKLLVDYFLMGVVVFTLVTFFSDTFLDFIQDIQRYGIAPGTAFILLWLQLPKSITLVLPPSTFLAVLLVYNHFNNTLELIACRVTGISLHRLVYPALVIGFFVTLLTYAMGDYLVPYCTKVQLALKQEAMQKGSLPVGEKSFMFKRFDDEHNLKMLIFVSSFNGHALGESTIVDLSKPKMMQITQAAIGTWHPDFWEFNTARIYTLKDTKTLLAFNTFEQLRVNNLLKQTDKSEPQGDINNRYNIASVSALDFQTLLQHIANREAQHLEIPPNTYIKLWEKISLPFSCIAMALIAVPLAISSPRKISNRGFVFALLILFLFYVLRSTSVAMGRSGVLSLFGLLDITQSYTLAAWLPVLVLTISGLWMLQKKSQRL
ncbi:MAG: LptF/LptG family permease [Cyanobacteria bacterium]|nr:LptF/LptG family permease [Cyanobacteriota bacterium]